MDVTSSKVESTAVGNKRSWVHEHYLVDTFSEKYECKLCDKQLAFSSTKSTGNITNHIKNCHRELYAEAVNSKRAKILPSANDKQETRKVKELISRKGFFEKLTNFVVETNQPLSIVEKESFRNLIDYITADSICTRLVCQETFTEQVEKAYKEKKEKLISKFKSLESKISLIIHGWISNDSLPYLGIVARFVTNDGFLETVPLHMTLLEGPHNDENMAGVFIPVLEEFSLTKKLLIITTDYADNNDTFFPYLAKLLESKEIPFDIFNQRVRCLAHVVNLCAEDAISVFKENETTGDALRKLDNAAREIRLTPQRRNLFKNHCCAQSREIKYPILSAKTRWNTIYAMIERALEIRPVLTVVLELNQDLRTYLLSEKQWAELTKLMKFLSPIIEATAMISSKGATNVSSSALIFQGLFTHFDSYLLKRKEIRLLHGTSDWQFEAAKEAKQRLEKYYPETDGAGYIVGTVLDPLFQLKWYKNNGWPANYIINARETVNKIWESNYKPREDSELLPSSAFDSNSEGFFSNLYDTQMANIYKSKKDELRKYLESELVTKAELRRAGGLLEWWKAQKSKYPHLYQMAVDYLAVSGSSVPVQKWFSCGLDIITPNRKSLPPEHIKMLMWLKCWNSSSSTFSRIDFS